MMLIGYKDTTSKRLKCSSISHRVIVLLDFLVSRIRSPVND